MPTFAANLTMLYADSPFLERFARAKASGFRFIEYLFPYEYDPGELARCLRDNGLKQVLFNLPAGRWVEGERGIAAHPDKIDAFRDGVRQATEMARALECSQVNCLVGTRDANVPIEDQRRVMVENLRYAATQLGENNIRLLVEPLNPFDLPNFLLVSPSEGFALLDEVQSPNLLLQYDVYHAQRTEGELANTIAKNLGRIGHIQVADNPGRHQPGTGEVNFPFLFRNLDRVGYNGYVALEYIPQGTTEESLAWIEAFGYTL